MKTEGIIILLAVVIVASLVIFMPSKKYPSSKQGVHQERAETLSRLLQIANETILVKMKHGKYPVDRENLVRTLTQNDPAFWNSDRFHDVWGNAFRVEIASNRMSLQSLGQNGVDDRLSYDDIVVVIDMDRDDVLDQRAIDPKSESPEGEKPQG